MFTLNPLNGLNAELVLIKRLQEYFSSGSVFIVAVSGGVDSMVLLNLISKITDYTFIIVSIDHSIRKDSNQDIQLVAKQAKQYHLQFFSEKVAVPSLARQKRKGLEEAARDIRYQILQKYKKKFQAAAIITAHHQDDQLETILFHLIRGSDMHGLVGMHTLNKQGIFRPLLTIPKQDLLQFAQDNKLQWREDSTNQDTTLSRNFIRKHLVKNFSRQIVLQVSSQAQATITAFDQYILQWLHINLSKNKFRRSTFLQLPLYLQLYLLQYITRNYFKLRDLSFSWLSSIYQWIINSKSNSSYMYKDRLLLRNEKGIIEIVPDIILSSEF